MKGHRAVKGQLLGIVKNPKFKLNRFSGGRGCDSVSICFERVYKNCFSKIRKNLFAMSEIDIPPSPNVFAELYTGFCYLF